MWSTESAKSTCWQDRFFLLPKKYLVFSMGLGVFVIWYSFAYKYEYIYVVYWISQIYLLARSFLLVA